MNFTVEALPGVSGKDVSDKAMSGDFFEGRENQKKEEGYGVIGCWRGHMNFASKYILRQAWPS